jgi:hypothetical protein
VIFGAFFASKFSGAAFVADSLPPGLHISRMPLDAPSLGSAIFYERTVFDNSQNQFRHE